MRHIQVEGRGEFSDLIEAGWHHRPYIHLSDDMSLILQDLDDDVLDHNLEVVIYHSVQDPGDFVYGIEKRA